MEEREMSNDDVFLIGRIAKRAALLAMDCGNEIEAWQFELCLTESHELCPLKLSELFEANDGNFAHDVFGLWQHLDRETGQIKDCFLPRYTA